MGLEWYYSMFIGRSCTHDEIQEFEERKQSQVDEKKWTTYYPSDIGGEYLMTVDGMPVLRFNDLHEDDDVDSLYVCQHMIKEWGEGDIFLLDGGFDYTTFPLPHDERFALLVVAQYI